MNLFGGHRIHPLTIGSKTEFDHWKRTDLPNNICPGLIRSKHDPQFVDKYPLSPDSIIWNPAAAEPLIRNSVHYQYDDNGKYIAGIDYSKGKQTISDPPADFMEFVNWLDSCPECGRFHRVQIEKRRSRPSDMRLHFWNYVFWSLRSISEFLINPNKGKPSSSEEKRNFLRPKGSGWENVKRRYLPWLIGNKKIDDIKEFLKSKLKDILGVRLAHWGTMFGGIAAGLICLIIVKIFPDLLGSLDGINVRAWEMLLIGSSLFITGISVYYDIKYWGLPGKRSIPLEYHRRPPPKPHSAEEKKKQEEEKK